MILLRDSLRLAFTKLRTRKIRLFITIVISGLLFGGLVAGSAVVRGAFASLADFGREGLGGRFIVQAQPLPIDSPDLIDRAMAIHKDIVAKKKVEAKKLGLEFNEQSEPLPYEEYPVGDGTKHKTLTYGHPAAIQATTEYYAAHPVPARPEIEKLAAPFSPKGLYEHLRFIPPSQGGDVKVMVNGQEQFTSSSEENSKDLQMSIRNTFPQFWAATDSNLMQPFVLPGQNLELGTDGSIPLIIPYSQAEALLELPPLPSAATATEKLTRIQEVRSKITSVQLKACYRNSTSSNLVGQAVAVQQELELNKNNKDYQKPDLIYGLPTEACGAVPITRDVRSKETKELQAKQDKLAYMFGTSDPEQQIISFRVVGVMADLNFGAAANVTSIVQALVASTLGQDWIAPLDVVKKHDTAKQLFADELYNLGGRTYFVELPTANKTRSFIASADCLLLDFSGFKDCTKDGKYFFMNPFGSNSLGLDDAQQMFTRIFSIAVLIVAAIACVIMSGMVGRMVADSRRETAVFRAMGAKRLDIAQIYILYTVLLCGLVAIFALLLGVGIALAVQANFAADVTPSVLLAFNVQDLTKQFSLFALDWADISYIVGLIVLAGLLSALLPLLRNLRRNPIKDMRDDT